MVWAKSGGVTSETNHGISLGLESDEVRRISKDHDDALKDHRGDVGCIRYQEVSKHEVREKLVFRQD